MNWRRTVEPALRPLMQAWWRRSRGLTLGVRAVAQDRAGRVVLVRHTYTPGWHLPGGGVERGETAIEAVRRELAEEAGLALAAPPRLIGVYANDAWFRGDHVLLFHATEWETCAPDCAGEIEAAEWFAPDALPEDATAATRRRLEELISGRPGNGVW